MRNALGLMLASVMTAVVITGVWFWTSSPRADAAPPPQTVAARKAEPLPAPAKLALKDDVETTARSRSRRPRPRPFPQPSRCDRRLRQSRCARRQPHRRDRHHGRSRLRLPAIQAVRLPDRQGSRAHVRRRSVADHARRAEGAGGRMHESRCSSRSASTPPIIRKFSARFPPPATPSARTPGRTRISTARR